MSKRIQQAEPLILLNDEPIQELEEDGLGLESWARIVAGVGLGTKGPFTIGIFGTWGSGKTSILRLARKLIDDSEQVERSGITTVEFNAWQYERENVPLIPLVASIVYELEKRKGTSDKVKGGIEKLHDALRSVLFGVSTKIAGKSTLIGEASVDFNASKAIERYEELRTQWIDQQVKDSLYYNAFQALRSTQLEEDKDNQHRVVVFIDDLDRCFPDKAVQLLESIKLVLNHPGFIFVLAVDRRILEGFLDKRYTEDFGLKDYQLGQSYLDKIIQLPLWIPPHEQRFEFFIQKLLDRPALQKYREGIEPLLIIIGLACEYNPRQLVRLFNDILVGQQVYRLADIHDEFPLRSFVVAHGIRHQSELVYQGLLRDQSLCNELKECKNADSLRSLLVKTIKEVKLDDFIAGILRVLQGRDSLIGLLASEFGREWLENSALRIRVDSFMASGWEATHREVAEVRWIQEQVGRALKELESSEEDRVINACQLLFELGDRTCLNPLRIAQSKWHEISRVESTISRTYRKLLSSYRPTQ